MPTRRDAVKALLASPILGASWVVPAVTLGLPQTNAPVPPPKILDKRPPITGEFGHTYFHVGVQPYFQKVFPGKRVYVDGKDVFDSCFETDLTGQWVGVITYTLETGESVPLDHGRISIPLSAVIKRQWICGRVEIR